MIRLALIGYGRIAQKHIAVFREQGATFVASCNRSEAGRQKAINQGRIPKVYASIEQMLSTEQPDGVICCPSVHENFWVAKQVLPFGIPTLLEKPPGTSLAELHELRGLAKTHQTPVMVALNRLWYSVLHRAIEDAGGLEAITAVFVEWSENPAHLMRRGFTPEQIAKHVYSNSLHGLSLLTFLAGDIPNPTFLGRNLGEPSCFRWLMSLQGISERGVLATFQSTWDSPGRWRLTFCSKGRRYTFAPLESCVVTETGDKEQRIIQPDAFDERFKAGFYKQGKAFLDLIKQGDIPNGLRLDDVVVPMRLAEELTVTCENLA